MRIRRVVVPAVIGLGLALLWLVGSHAFSAMAASKPTGANVAGNVWYVNANVTGSSGSGVTWTHAFTRLQVALDYAAPGDQIWVAEGVYTPTNSSGCTATFQLIGGVALYGGFAATETVREERDWEANVTVLSGDLSGDDVTDDNGVVTDTGHISGSNACHVVTGSGVTETAVLDGFVITAGKADGAASEDRNGGGLYNDGGSPTLRRMVFGGNFASVWGGAMFNSGGNPTVDRVMFTGNRAGTAGNPGYGGGMSNRAGSNPTLSNVIFSDNFASNRGGGLYNNNSNPSLTNVSFSKNAAQVAGGAMRNYDHSSPSLTNCVFWGNTPLDPQISNRESSTPTISYSDIQFSGGSASWDSTLGVDGGGNIDQDPQFVDPDGPDGTSGTPDDDLRLQIGSPCIDAGMETGNVPYDFGGDQRPWDQKPEQALDVDMGADEVSNCYDLNASGGPVDIGDVQVIAGRWREPADYPPYDIDGDGLTTIVEIMTVVSHWGESCRNN